MTNFDRRDFLKLLGLAGLSIAAPWPLRQARAQSIGMYDGPIFVSVAASGGWDPTSFCDPKMNIPGEAEITQWSRTDETRTIADSSITYAPFANNEQFFERFHGDMLVINGIDTETNSHDVGIRTNWSGRMQPGYPAFAAIAANVFGEDLPLPFLTNGGYRETAGLSTYTEVAGVRDLQELVDVNRVAGKDRIYHEADEVEIIERYQAERLQARLEQSNLLPRNRRSMENFAIARANREQLQSLLVSLPDQLVNPIDQNGNRNSLLQQAQMAMIAASAGLTVACDLEIGGFDTHQNHDTNHRRALQMLTNGVTYLWDTAEALGIADRLVVLIASDFGRTPRYNDGNGKDHWPTTSALFMKRGMTWTDRAVGASDEGHSALAINPGTLRVATGAAGVDLHPAHVQDLFRRIAGVQNHESVRRFPLNAPFVDFLQEVA